MGREGGMPQCRETVLNQECLSESPGGAFPKHIFLSSTLYLLNHQLGYSPKSSLDDFDALHWFSGKSIEQEVRFCWGICGQFDPREGTFQYWSLSLSFLIIEKDWWVQWSLRFLQTATFYDFEDNFPEVFFKLIQSFFWKQIIV